MLLFEDTYLSKNKSLCIIKRADCAVYQQLWGIYSTLFGSLDKEWLFYREGINQLMKIMKHQILILAAAISSFALVSCNSSEENAETAMDSSEMEIEETMSENSEIAVIAPQEVVYTETSYIGKFPLADTVMKYSSDGAANYRLTKNMTSLAEEITANLGDKASILQYGEGIIVALDRGDIFEKDEAKLNENTKDILRHLAFNLQKEQDTYIMVAGRADSDGKTDKNDKLAYKRAAVAANYLHGCGVDEDRFFVDSYGEKYPDYRNNSKLNKERNRRVDFLIIPSNEMRELVTAR